jgi:hypothetical protein
MGSSAEEAVDRAPRVMPSMALNLEQLIGAQIGVTLSLDPDT